MAVRLNLVPMVYCARCVSVVWPKCLTLNLVMSNSVVNSDLDFECAIYYWRNGGIYGMESLGFEQRSAVLVDFGFDWRDEMWAVAVSLYCADDDSAMVLNWSMPLVVYYTVEQYPNHLLTVAISINSKHCRLLIPRFSQGKSVWIYIVIYHNSKRRLTKLTTHEFVKLALLPATPELFDPTAAFICWSVGVTDGVGVGVGTGVCETIKLNRQHKNEV